MLKNILKESLGSFGYNLTGYHEIYIDRYPGKVGNVEFLGLAGKTYNLINFSKRYKLKKI